MLEPEAFGSYYAVGQNGRVFGQAMFFEVDPSFRSERFRRSRSPTSAA
jgi:hypothetical protein